MTSTAVAERGRLEEFELFRGLDGAALAKLEAIAARQRFGAGTRMFNLGEEATRMLLIAAGTVHLTLPLTVRKSAHEVTIDEKGPGSVLAWSALVPPQKLTLGAVAATDVTVVGFERRALEDVFRNDRRIQLVVSTNLNQVIAGRVAVLEAQLIRELQRWVADRFA